MTLMTPFLHIGFSADTVSSAVSSDDPGALNWHVGRSRALAVSIDRCNVASIIDHRQLRCLMYVPNSYDQELRR